MDVQAFEEWLEDYFLAWRSNDPADVEALFADDAIYYRGPFEEPDRGRAAIVEAWVVGGGADIIYAYDVLGVLNDIGIAHWSVSYTPRDLTSEQPDLDGVFVIRFDAEGRCVEHREWFHRRDERP